MHRSRKELCLVFGGQGAQWLGMGVQLLRIPTCAATIRKASSFLSSLGCEWSVLDELEEFSNGNEIEKGLILCTIIQMALVDLLDSWRIRPTINLGHSSGEIAAAYANGALDDEEALLLVWRAAIAFAQARPGSMLAIALSASDTISFASQTKYPDEIYVACENSASNTTVSGSRRSIGALRRSLNKACIPNKALDVHVAYHSALIWPTQRTLLEAENYSMAKESRCEIQQVKDRASDIIHALTRPVLFHSRMASILRLPEIGAALEIGSHGTLRNAIQDIALECDRRDFQYHALMQRQGDVRETALHAMTELQAAGFDIDCGVVRQSLYGDLI